MSTPTPLPRELFVAPKTTTQSGFLDSLEDDDLLYFVLNVGDGDSQVLVLPKLGPGRRVVIVDIYRYDKTKKLIEVLQKSKIIPSTGNKDLRFLVVATHPHKDHIAGIPRFLKEFDRNIWEYWDGGYRHTGQDFQRLAVALEALQAAHVRQPRTMPFQMSLPTAGMKRFMDDVGLTVLAPSIRLRNRYDTFGVEANDASLVLKVEYPTHRVFLQESPERRRARLRKTTTLILGGDAQTHSWGTAMHDFPKVYGKQSLVADELRVTLEDSEPLSADIFKVPHHGSKRGLNLELIERIEPALSLVSCKRQGSNYDFPHDVAQASLREAVQATAKRHKVRRPDWALGIHYTSDLLAPGQGFASTQDAAARVIDAYEAIDDALEPKALAPNAADAVAANLAAIRAATGHRSGVQAAEATLAALEAVYEATGRQDRQQLAAALRADPSIWAGDGDGSPHGEADETLGSMAVVVSRSGTQRLWRFRDGPKQDEISFDEAIRFIGPGVG